MFLFPLKIYHLLNISVISYLINYVSEHGGTRRYVNFHVQVGQLIIRDEQWF